MLKEYFFFDIIKYKRTLWCRDLVNVKNTWNLAFIHLLLTYLFNRPHQANTCHFVRHPRISLFSLKDCQAQVVLKSMCLTRGHRYNPSYAGKILTSDGSWEFFRNGLVICYPTLAWAVWLLKRFKFFWNKRLSKYGTVCACMRACLRRAYKPLCRDVAGSNSGQIKGVNIGKTQALSRLMQQSATFVIWLEDCWKRRKNTNHTHICKCEFVSMSVCVLCVCVFSVCVCVCVCVVYVCVCVCVCVYCMQSQSRLPY